MSQKITLTRTAFDALPIHQTPPPRGTCDVWRTGVGRLWFYCERVEVAQGVPGFVIREIVIEDEADQ